MLYPLRIFIFDEHIILHKYAHVKVFSEYFLFLLHIYECVFIAQCCFVGNTSF